MSVVRNKRRHLTKKESPAFTWNRGKPPFPHLELSIYRIYHNPEADMSLDVSLSPQYYPGYNDVR